MSKVLVKQFTVNIKERKTTFRSLPGVVINNRRKFARLIKQYRNIFSNISEGTAFLLQGVTENDSSFKRYKFKIWEMRYD